MSDNYTAESIEVLTGLDPVKKRPGMYTDTSRPNHLAQEVIDNSVDEVIAGFATKIILTLHEDGSIEVEDDGRGMPVDIHPQSGLSGVEVIMTKLHAGGKFSDKTYQFSGGLHGVGVSVVNALSERLDVSSKRNGVIYHMRFANGQKQQELNEVGTTKKQDTGTIVRFWPNPSYFDTTKIAIKQLMHILRAKAVLCSGLSVTFINKQTDEVNHWCYEKGLPNYLCQSLTRDYFPEIPFAGETTHEEGAIEWAVVWSTSPGEQVGESYVNLIPTIQGGTHVNGLRSGLFEALVTFCELRNLIPRGVKLAAEDLWGLILSAPRNRVLHIPDAMPDRAMLERYIRNGLTVFLRAYSARVDADLALLSTLVPPPPSSPASSSPRCAGSTAASPSTSRLLGVCQLEVIFSFTVTLFSTFFTP